MKRSIETLVNQIVAFNRAWHRSKARYEEDTHPLNTLTRDRKAALQAELLRDHFPKVWLETHQVSGKEDLYSVQLATPVKLASGESKPNADHMPYRIANKIFTSAELELFTNSRSER